MATFYGRQSMHWLLFKPLYNGYLPTTPTFFFPQVGHCGEVQLYVCYISRDCTELPGQANIKGY